MNTVLVTGGAGFIGSHLCEKLLELGYRVINLDNFNDFYDPKIKRKNISAALSNRRYTLIEGDIRDRKLLEKIFNEYSIDTIVHIAALAGVRTSVGN
ncbi:MAG TPA: SDR family NAD(P)-dependent oxidoreductase, partial [Bacillota bacterium]|nr:SDR family NAD(P)-dependent oxidoreductase [Bacillota bacterium]